MDEFMTIPELQQNPLVKRVIDILDKDGNGEVDFQGQKAIIFYCILWKCCVAKQKRLNACMNIIILSGKLTFLQLKISLSHDHVILVHVVMVGYVSRCLYM